MPVIGSINFLAAFKNTKNGQESLVYAAAGLRMHVRYFVERSDSDPSRSGTADTELEPNELPPASAQEAEPSWLRKSLDAEKAFKEAGSWSFLADKGEQWMLREECTLQANAFLMPFITFNFESVHRRMHAQMFELLGKGEGPEGT